MYHDFVDGGTPYKGNCRRHKDSSQKPCNQCQNYNAVSSSQPLKAVTGHAEDCCNGYMGYYNHPHFWSDCSVRFFEQFFDSKNWKQCMDTGKFF